MKSEQELILKSIKTLNKYKAVEETLDQNGNKVYFIKDYEKLVLSLDSVKAFRKRKETKPVSPSSSFLKNRDIFDEEDQEFYENMAEDLYIHDGINLDFNNPEWQELILAIRNTKAFLWYINDALKTYYEYKDSNTIKMPSKYVLTIIRNRVAEAKMANQPLIPKWEEVKDEPTLEELEKIFK